MKTKHFGQVVERHVIADKILIRREVTLRRNEVFAALDELVLRLEHLRIVEIFQNDHDANSVVGVRHTSTIICFCNHISESIIRNNFEMI